MPTVDPARFSDPRAPQTPAMQKILITVEQEQKTRLEADCFTTEVESTRVKCTACEKYVELDEPPLPGGPGYDMVQWGEHRRTCRTIHAIVENWYQENCEKADADEVLEVMLGLNVPPMPDFTSAIEDIILSMCREGKNRSVHGESNRWGPYIGR